jgi:hypothetical protein
MLAATIIVKVLWRAESMKRVAKRVALAVCHAIAALLLLLPPPLAHADILNLAASQAGSISFQGATPSPGNVAVTFTDLAGFGSLSSAPAIVGNYALLAPAPATFIAGPINAADNLPVSGVNQVFGYTAANGVLAGIVSWALIQGSTADPEFIGSFSGFGSGVFAGIAAGLHIDLITTTLPITSLADLATAHAVAHGGVSSGGIERTANAVPFDAVGSGAPGAAIVGCGILFWLARRRRTNVLGMIGI